MMANKPKSQTDGGVAIGDVFPLRAVDLQAYQTRQVQVGNFSPYQRRVLSMLAKGLKETNAQLINGRHVDTVADTIRYVLERLGELQGLK